jgi:serine/threonine protein kinase/tetratricopeptide (TPR) repeat protein
MIVKTPVSDRSTPENPKSPLRALYDWLKGPLPSPASPATAPDPGVAPAEPLPARLGHYAITRKLGQGGMGVVYAARDERLHREVALKTMVSVLQDETARQRFWREARAAASVNHPNVCQIYEIGEDQGELFIAMELLEGQPLSEPLKNGPMPVADAVAIAVGMLSALSALHARGIVHRDLKPSNVFLTPHGVKLLDFGLARPTSDVMATAPELTRAGTVIGTPRYMAPEQVLGEPIDTRTDLFAAGAIIFEMLAGRPAFTGRTIVEIAHATIYEQPPALTGGAAVAAVDRVLRRALAKKAPERYASADEMADDLRSTRQTNSDPTAAIAQALTRLVVLPFRPLRPDTETDFLAFSLPDAITTSLSGVGSLIVRSSATAARFASDAPDFKAVAAEADVDRVVTGTILRSGDQLRVVAQLLEAPNGTVLASHTVQSTLGDLFGLQDDIARRLVDALSLPLTNSTPPPATAAAAPNARAYELYLRANEIARKYDGLPRARELYERCVALDPSFAPAWARLGRCHRVIGKYIDPTPDSDKRAEECLRRALELNPRLTIAHKLYANLEADSGRGEHALVRLLGEATRHGNDPELFAGIVHAARYCGLYDESIAADAEARRLDPNVSTSVEQTLLMAGQVDRILSMPLVEVVAGADDGIRVIGLGFAGRLDEARALLDQMTARPNIPAFETWTTYLRAWLDRRVPEVLRGPGTPGRLKIEDDPEAIFQEGWFFCDVGEHARGLPLLERAVARGYFASFTLANQSQFEPIRSTPAFQSLLADAESGRQRALAAFRAAGGDKLLGR